MLGRSVPYTFKCASNLERARFVKVDKATRVASYTGVGEVPDGVTAQDSYNGTVAVYPMASLAVHELLVRLGGDVAMGAGLESGADGVAVTVDQAQDAVCYAIQAEKSGAVVATYTLK